MVKTFQLPEFGYEVEIGKIAQQADGAVWFKSGGTILLATVVAAPTKEFPGFLPLTVEYKEQFSAAGKIPGGYFKREGKSTDKEVLTSRLIDRALRPLFPETYFNEVQIITTVYSVDREHMPGTMALVAASLALSISKIPFMGPVGVVEVARIKGEWVFNPTYVQAQESDVRIIVAGTHEGINMVEGSMHEISESDLLTILFKAHEKIKQQVAWQESISKELHVAKDTDYEDPIWPAIKKDVEDFLIPNRLDSVFNPQKESRNEAIAQLKDSFFEHMHAKMGDDVSERLINYMFEKEFAHRVTQAIFKRKSRIDGRAFDQVRVISVEVGLLPFTHGSSLFTRGNTQALASVTLGSGEDQQQVDTLMGNIEKTFMLHYNFLPFSSGEVRPMRGPGRREIGHGYLAASALEQVMPSQVKFPYTTRIVVDILESDGSTSMATTCAGTMALLNAGVPIKKMVSGIAMGLLQSENGDFFALSDINGNEDAYGLMDFKVTGTQDGITAIQMDIKYKGGLPKEVFEKALKQSHEGRLFILGEMQKVMHEPNSTLSPLVPQVISFKVPTEKIGAIIGTGGKIIKEIIERTDTSIDIDDDGTVKIYGKPGPKLDEAISWVKALGGSIEKGTHYKGKVKRVTEFGIFVEIAPGQDGLIHISMIPKAKQANMAKDYPVGMELAVEVADYDPTTGRIRLRPL